MGISAYRSQALIFAAHVILALVVGLYAVVTNAPRTIQVVAHWSEIRAAYPIRGAAAKIAADKNDGDKVWALENHLVLWYLHQMPISRAATHPSNLVDEPIIGTLTRGGYVRPGEFERVLSSEPKYVITGRSKNPLVSRWLPHGAISTIVVRKNMCCGSRLISFLSIVAKGSAAPLHGADVRSEHGGEAEWLYCDRRATSSPRGAMRIATIQLAYATALDIVRGSSLAPALTQRRRTPAFMRIQTGAKIGISRK